MVSVSQRQTKVVVTLSQEVETELHVLQLVSERGLSLHRAAWPGGSPPPGSPASPVTISHTRTVTHTHSHHVTHSHTYTQSPRHTQSHIHTVTMSHTVIVSSCMHPHHVRKLTHPKWGGFESSELLCKTCPHQYLNLVVESLQSLPSQQVCPPLQAVAMDACLWDRGRREEERGRGGEGGGGRERERGEGGREGGRDRGREYMSTFRRVIYMYMYTVMYLNTCAVIY